jgi:diguanylate cyclase (GGDEF)-like protein/hemerythrin-like metal-binding protein/PAS domain S-box-containing protein
LPCNMMNKQNNRILLSRTPSGPADKTVDFIWLYDLLAQHFRYASPAFCSLFGCSGEEMLAKSLTDILSPDAGTLLADLEKRLIRFLSGDQDADQERLTETYTLCCQDGSTRVLDVSSRLIHDPGTGSVDVLAMACVTAAQQPAGHPADPADARDLSIRQLLASEKELASLALDLLARNEALKDLSVTDEMTGIYNRHYLDRRIQEEIERADRYGSALGLIIVDLDHFKDINDTWGHDAGDNVLVSLTDIIKRNIRKPDILARWGGEEFVLLVPQTDLAGTIALAEKLRDAISVVQHPGIGVVTASFGVAERIGNEPFANWFRRADQALYLAKSKGRNRVVCGSEAGIALGSARLDWNPVWDCGHRLIDDQHRGLIGLANQLIDLPADQVSSESAAALFRQLVESIVHHFTDEERILAEAGYPDLLHHAERHQNMIRRITRLNNYLQQAELKPTTFFTFLVDEIIVGHLLTEDVLFFPYLR